MVLLSSHPQIVHYLQAPGAHNVVFPLRRAVGGSHSPHLDRHGGLHVLHAGAHRHRSSIGAHNHRDGLQRKGTRLRFSYRDQRYMISRNFQLHRTATSTPSYKGLLPPHTLIHRTAASTPSYIGIYWHVRGSPPGESYNTSMH